VAHGTIELDVKDSIKPKARIVSIPAQTLNVGTSKTLDVFDGASNPYAPEPLYLDPASVQVQPAGAVTAKAKSNGQVTVTALVKPTEFNAKVLFTYNDYLRRPDRAQSGYFVVAVLERPGTPTAPTVGDPNDQGVVTVTWEAPVANGAPITDYQVRVSDGTTHDCGAVTECQVGGLTMGDQYSFQVRAQNVAGWSGWSGKSMTDRVVIAPGQVGAGGASVSGLSVTAGDSKLDVKWSAPSDRGSAIKSYDVQVSSPDGGSVPSGGMVTVSDGSATRVTLGGLDNGKSYNVRIRARNWKVGDWSDWVTGKVPSGAPGQFTVTGVARTSSSEFKVSWSAADPNGVVKAGGALSYGVWASEDGPDGAAKELVSDVPGKQTSASMPASDAGVTYHIWVEATGTLDGKKLTTRSTGGTWDKEQWAPVAAPGSISATGACATDGSGAADSTSTTTPAAALCDKAVGEGTITASWSDPDSSPYAFYKPWLSTGATKPGSQTVSTTSFNQLKHGSYEVGVSACVDTSALDGYEAGDATSGEVKDLCPSNKDSTSWLSIAPNQTSSPTNVYTLPDTMSQVQVQRVVQGKDSGNGQHLEVTYDTSGYDDGGGVGFTINYKYVTADGGIATGAIDANGTSTETILGGAGEVTLSVSTALGTVAQPGTFPVVAYSSGN
jgi:hypothetical protein